MQVGVDYYLQELRHLELMKAFFVTVEGDGMDEQEIRAGDTLIVDRSRTPGPRSIVVAVIVGELSVRPFSALDREEACVWGVVSGLVRDLP